MTNRINPPLKLRRSPLIFVLAQVQFQPLLAMKDRMPTLQESLRKIGYLKLNQREVTVTRQDPQNNEVTKESISQWEFVDRSNRNSVLVDKHFVNLQCTNYEVFESFMGKWKEVLEIFNRHVEPDLVTRLGLRYVDLILPSEGKTVDDYVAEGLRGFQVNKGEDRQAYFFESIINTGVNQLFIHRYAEAKHGIGFPPDLLPLNLTTPHPVRRDSPFGLLDMDHMLTQEQDFDVSELLLGFWNLHAHHEMAFHASVKTEAINEWEKTQ